MNVDLTTILVITGAIIAGVVLSRFMRARSKWSWEATDKSALPLKADMCGATRDVRFGPKADIGRIGRRRRLIVAPRQAEFQMR
jgi:hypothetical protein